MCIWMRACDAFASTIRIPKVRAMNVIQRLASSHGNKTPTQHSKQNTIAIKPQRHGLQI